MIDRLPGDAGERHLADKVEQDDSAAFAHVRSGSLIKPAPTTAGAKNSSGAVVAAPFACRSRSAACGRTHRRIESGERFEPVENKPVDRQPLAREALAVA